MYDVQTNIMAPLCFRGMQNIATVQQLAHLGILTNPTTTARLGFNGRIVPLTQPVQRFFDPAKARIFAEKFIKLANANVEVYRADPIKLSTIIPFILTDNVAEAEIRRKQVLIDDFESTLLNFSSDVGNWPIVPLLIDLCTLEGEILEQYVDRHLPKIKVILLVISCAISDTVRLKRKGAGIQYTVGDLGINTLRTTARAQTISYDIGRQYYMAKFLQILLSLIMPILERHQSAKLRAENKELSVITTLLSQATVLSQADPDKMAINVIHQTIGNIRDLMTLIQLDHEDDSRFDTALALLQSKLQELENSVPEDRLGQFEPDDRSDGQSYFSAVDMDVASLTTELDH
jgi:hypothetical protein